jgi:hypothetical protein
LPVRCGKNFRDRNRNILKTEKKHSLKSTQKAGLKHLKNGERCNEISCVFGWDRPYFFFLLRNYLAFCRILGCFNAICVSENVEGFPENRRSFSYFQDIHRYALNCIDNDLLRGHENQNFQLTLLQPFLSGAFRS